MKRINKICAGATMLFISMVILGLVSRPGSTKEMEMPEFAGISHWLNTEKPVSKEDLKGKVVLVAFWTHGCINCIHTLPTVNSWHEKYRDKGFEIIGVHSPEFDFEKKLDKVRAAIKKYNIQYPVALDNEFETWNSYSNRYWPAHYFIDRKGKIRFQHFGEGNYAVSERYIQTLLAEDDK